MAKPRLTRAQVVKMKRSIITNVNLILETKDKLSKDKMIEEECVKYDWYRDVVDYLGVEAILEYDCNIFDLKKAFYNEKYKQGINRMDASYNNAISKLRSYLIDEGIVEYGLTYKLSDCSRILREACYKLDLPPLTSSAYFSVLFDVKYCGGLGYKVISKYTGNGLKLNHPIMKGN